MLSTESLTSSPTSLFWLTVAILVLTVAVVAIGVVTWYSATARKKLRLTIASRSQLLSAPESMRDDLQIEYKKEALHGDTYVTAIELVNVGRSSIKTLDFDDKRSLQFTLDTRIIKHLSTDHSPNSSPTPEVTATDSVFSLKPEVITKGEVIKIALLTEGRPTQATTAFSPLGDIPIEISDRELEEIKRNRRTRIMTLAAAAMLTATIILIIIALIISLNIAINSTFLSIGSIKFTACDELRKDLINTDAVLRIVQAQTPALQGPHPEPAAILKSYDLLLLDAKANLITLNGDYEAGYQSGIFSDKSVKMESLIKRASTIIDEMMKTRNPSTLSNLVGRLTPIEKSLSSPQAIPNSCGK